MLDLRDVSLFVAVVDGGSITAGAAATGLSLSAASTRLTQLERTIGTPLMRRGRTGVTLTPAGETFDAHARRVLTEAGALERSIADHVRGRRREVRLASNTSAVDTLTEFLAATLARLPDVRIVLAETSSADAVRQVSDGLADLAVVSAEVDDPTLIADELWPDPLVLVQRLTGRSARARSFAEAVSRPMIGLTEPSPLQALVDREAASLGIAPEYRVRLPTLAAVYAVATTGAGVGVIPLSTARRLGADERSLHRLDEPWAQRTARLIRARRDAHRGARAEVAAALLRYRSEVRETI